MVESFYGSLAASASVFIAILTALISNQLVGIESEKRRLNQRKQDISRQLENLRARKKSIIDEIKSIERTRESEAEREARENVEEFIEYIDRSEIELPPEIATEEDIYSLFSEYIGREAERIDEGINSDPHKSELRKRTAEIKANLAWSSAKSFRKDYDFSYASTFNPLSDTTTKADKEAFIESYKDEHNIEDLYSFSRNALVEIFKIEMKPGMDMHLFDARYSSGPTVYNDPSNIEDNRYKNLQQEKKKVEIEIEGKETEVNDIEQDLSSYDTKELLPIFYATLVSVAVSVVVPLGTYLAEERNICHICSGFIANNWMVIVFVLWGLGFLLTFAVLYMEIKYDVDSLYDRI
ncbi:hypothetical protein [Natronorubrum sp. DTA7]|uniref:hypothetical protein n=1 Tax=Natronorubrum sp. DTA7 TaxID=3447016 RepID=UPI003F85BEF7